MRISAGTIDSAVSRRFAHARVVRLCAAASLALLALSGCSEGSKPASGGTERPGGGGAPAGNETPLATEPMAHDDGPAHVDLLALNRTANNTVTARLRVVNDGQDTLSLDHALEDTAFKAGPSDAANGIVLLDGVNSKAYYPLTAAGGACMCSDLSTADLEAGKTQEIYAVFPAPPATTNRVTVWVPLTVPFPDMNIGAGQAPPAPDQTMDPAKTQLGQPVIRSLVDTAESDLAGVDTDDLNERVRLTADVLFAFNKANLTPRANTVLRRVAGQINAAKGTTVKIDGYTDNIGSDAVNQPLSERRAQSVLTALKGMVTRQGITFQAAGHGSQNPIAKNDDEAGRRRNRRVTILFAKPPAPQSAPASQGSPFRWTPGGKLPVIATTRPNFGGSAAAVEQDANDFKLDVNSLHRDPSGLVTLVWTVTNVTDEEQSISGGQFGRYLSLEYSVPFSTSGVSLIDKAGQMRYWPARDGQGVCMCNTMNIDSHGAQTLKPNGSATFADVYKMPAGVGTVDVQFAWLGSPIPPAAGVPVK